MRARDNPFAVQRVLAVRYRLAGVTWEELQARLAAHRFRAAIVGPHGHGKTTLLEDLGERLGDQGFRIRTATLHEGERRLGPRRSAALFRDPHPRDLLLVDGAEQLDRLAWWHLRRRSQAASGLIVTSHFQGLLPTLHECRTTPELFASIATELGGAKARQTASGLFVRHQGNLRDALRELYDLHANVANP
jgi:ATPase subunit of ABC transporter with duplicated ATPase domains